MSKTAPKAPTAPKTNEQLEAAELEAEKAEQLEAEKAAELEAEKAAQLEAEKAAELEAEKAAELEAEKAALRTQTVKITMKDVPVEELPNVLMVKNLKGQKLKVNKAYYQSNSHKLTIVANA